MLIDVFDSHLAALRFGYLLIDDGDASPLAPPQWQVWSAVSWIFGLLFVTFSYTRMMVRRIAPSNLNRPAQETLATLCGASLYFSLAFVPLTVVTTVPLGLMGLAALAVGVISGCVLSLVYIGPHELYPHGYKPKTPTPTERELRMLTRRYRHRGWMLIASIPYLALLGGLAIGLRSSDRLQLPLAGFIAAAIFLGSLMMLSVAYAGWWIQANQVVRSIARRRHIQPYTVDETG